MFEVKDEFNGLKIKNLECSDPRTAFRYIGGDIIAITDACLFGFADSLDTGSGFSIYVSSYDDSKIVRLYNDCDPINYKYSDHTDDAKLFAELAAKQKVIKLTEFPSAIITYNDKVVGHEAPYYKNQKTFMQAAQSGLELGKMIHHLRYGLRAIKEMYDNGIAYLDIHGGNFMVDEENNQTHVIDFDSKYMRVKKEDEKYFGIYYSDLVERYVRMVQNKILPLYGIEIDLAFAQNFETLDLALANINKIYADDTDNDKTYEEKYSKQYKYGTMRTLNSFSNCKVVA